MAQSFTTQNLTTTGGLAAKMKTYYDRKFLDTLRPKLVYHQYGTSKTLPEGEGKTVQWYRRTDLSANTTPLTEGTTPNPISLGASSLTATLAQYGDWTQTSDLIQLTSIDEEISAAVELLAFRARKTLDSLDRALLDAETTGNIYISGTALIDVGATDVLTGAVVRNAVRTLKANNADAYDNGYVALVHPNVSYDLFGDTAGGGWVNANTYVNAENLQKGMIGRYFGASFVETTEVTRTTTGTAGGAAAYYNHFLAQGAFGVVDFAGGINSFVKKPSDSDTSNPLNLYSTVGYKMTYANKILDANRKVTVVAGSGN